MILAWLLACLLWSGTFLFIRIGLADVGPFTFAASRLVLALVVLVPLVSMRREWARWTVDDVLQVAAAGILLLGINYALVYWGAQFVSSGLVAILLATTPVVALALGALLGVEDATRRKIAAVTLGLGGVVIIFGTEARISGAAGIRGAVAVMISACCVAGAYVWMKGRTRHVPPLSMAAIQGAAGLVPLGVLALALEGHPLAAAWSATSVAALAYLAIGGSVVAFWLNYWLLARMDPSAMLMMGVAEVPIAVGLGALVLGERVPPGTIAGGACILAAVLLGLLRREDAP